MSWTIVCDLQMNEYQGNRVLDASEYHNDAILQGNILKRSGCVSFESLDAQLEVPVHDESLGRFEALRIQALFRPAPITRRFNLIEGWMSFALVIRDDGRLVARSTTGRAGSRLTAVRPPLHQTNGHVSYLSMTA